MQWWNVREISFSEKKWRQMGRESCWSPSCEVNGRLRERPSRSQADDSLFIDSCLWSVENRMWWLVIHAHGFRQMLLNDWMNVHMFRDGLCWIQSDSSSDSINLCRPEHVNKCYHETSTFNPYLVVLSQRLGYIFNSPLFSAITQVSWPQVETRDVTDYTHLVPYLGDYSLQFLRVQHAKSRQNHSLCLSGEASSKGPKQISQYGHSLYLPTEALLKKNTTTYTAIFFTELQ